MPQADHHNNTELEQMDRLQGALHRAMAIIDMLRAMSDDSANPPDLHLPQANFLITMIAIGEYLDEVHESAVALDGLRMSRAKAA